jgi:hypothetical protein
MILTFIEDAERLMPSESYMSQISFASGEVDFDITSGWHDVTKNEVADTMVSISHLDYVTDFTIPSIVEEYKTLICLGYDDEGNPIFLTDTYENREEEEQPDSINPEEITEIKTDEGVLVEYEDGMDLPEGIEEYTLITLRQTTYSAHCHIHRPADVDQEVAVPEAPGTVTEEAPAEGGEQ